MQHRGAKVFLGVLIAFFAVSLSVFFNAGHASAANPTTMNFQGKVVNADGTNVTNGSYDFVFKLYTVSSSGTEIWAETRSLTVTNGVFQVDLGGSCPFFTTNACNNNTIIDFNANNSLYLGIRFNNDAQGEMTPRVKLQSVPFAFNSDKVGGLTASQLVQLSPGSQQTGNINVSGSGTFATGLVVTGAAVNINVTSNFGTNINTGTSTGAISLGNSAAGAITLQSAAAINLTAGAASTWSTGGNSLTITSSNLNLSSLGVMTLAGGQTADITTAAAATGTAITLKPGTSSGASSNGAALTVSAGDGSGTTSVTGGALVLTAGNATGGAGTRNGGNVTIDAGTGATVNGTVSIGTTNAAAVSVGNATGTFALNSNTVDISGAGAISGVTTLGLSGAITGATSTDTINGLIINTGALSGVAGYTQTSGNFSVAGSGTFTLGDAAGTTALTLGQSTASNTINIGSANTANGNTQTINLGAGTPAGTGKATVLIGNTANASSVGIRAGTGGINLGGSVSFQKGTDFSTTGTNNNTDFGNGSVIRLTGASAQTITGVLNGVDGRILTLVNAAGQSAVISNEDTLSTAGNRIVTGKNASVNLLAGASITMVYDSSSSRWRVIGAVASTGGGGGAADLQEAYDAAASPEIVLNNTNNGLTIRNMAADAITGNLLEIQNSAGTATFLGVSSSEVRLQDSGGNVAFLFDSATSELRVYDNSASPTAYARIYYSGGEAVFAASTGTTRVGAGSGNITMSLTNAADVLTFTKSATLGGNYTSTDFSVTRSITAGAHAATGHVLKVEDLTTVGAGSSAPNLLYLNQSNTSATGNLILAQLGGASNDKFKVSTQGTVTLAAGQSFTSAGALTVAAGAGTALTLTSPTAATWGTTAGDLTIQAGGANTVILKPGTNSASGVEVQNASGTSMLAFDSSANQIEVGVSDTTGTLLILDTKTDTGDPTGVNGGMYYNSNANKFRCYENSAWVDCVSPIKTLRVAADFSNNTTTGQDVTGLTWAVAANTDYSFACTIIASTALATAGIQMAVNGPASPTQYTAYISIPTAATSADVPSTQTTLETYLANTAGQTTRVVGDIKGVLRNGANAGTGAIRLKSENTTAVTVHRGSFCTVW